MFDQWKKKLKNIFTEEVEVEVEEVVEIKANHSLHNKESKQVETRMMYQYPERNSFRFPVIPDEPTKETTNRPSKIKADQEKTAPAITKDDKREKRTYEDPIRKDRKVYKKNPDVPFQPTDVPSPIYGYQKRQQENEIENVPAYKRKDQIQEGKRNERPAFIPKNTEEHGRKSAVSAIEENKKAETITKASSPELEETRPVITAEKEAAATQEPAESEVKMKNTYPGKQERRTTEKVNPISTQQVSERRSRGASDPFNVIMTPRDKKRLYDRKRNEARKQQITPIEKIETEQEKETLHQQSAVEQEVIDIINEQQPKPERDIPVHLLNDPVEKNNDDNIWVMEQQQLLEQTLKYFNVRARVVKATQGPSVTRFEVHPELGVKVSKIKNLSDDLKLNMSARDIRIEAPIPGKNTVGIEVPNPKAEMVGLQRIFETEEFKESESPLSIALGLTIEGNPKVTNIQKMPHGLIAGATGSGKSVCINTILISLIYKANHEDVKFLLIDPKMVELAPYNGIPHLVAPVITDVKAATQSLKWAVNEMEERYEKFVEEGVRDIERYNQKVIKQGRPNAKMPFIVIVIDELADLMMMSPQDVEDSISRIAQKARACGIHLLLATQRPSVDVITGLIKANIPTRIAFSVSSQIDSRTIIDSSGAEKLLGRGDMLFVENGAGKSVRLQGPFVSDEEIERVTSYARSIAEPNYLFEQEQLLEQITLDEDADELMDEAIQFVMNHRSASTSLLQRHFKIGYNRAARLIDALEERGIISGQNGSKPREVLVSPSQLDEM
ncbi:DNA translocase FtsK [Oceanobacillus sp. FSL K6-2867]|uniref:DNA translocase FtsK n=1 Tax=Oceanobacillus sp. FSL K6-2867 TaxID=2954748 RepID=UPI0030DAB1C0